MSTLAPRCITSSVGLLLKGARPGALAAGSCAAATLENTTTAATRGPRDERLIEITSLGDSFSEEKVYR
jgi:hypothetical protein